MSRKPLIHTMRKQKKALAKNRSKLPPCGPLIRLLSGPLVITAGPRPHLLFPITGSDSLILKVLHDLVNTASIKPTHFNHFYPEDGSLFCTHNFKNWFAHKKYMFKQ